MTPFALDVARRSHMGFGVLEKPSEWRFGPHILGYSLFHIPAEPSRPVGAILIHNDHAKRTTRQTDHTGIEETANIVVEGRVTHPGGHKASLVSFFRNTDVS